MMTEIQQVMDVERGEGEPVGLTVDDNLVVVKVAPASPAEEGKLRPGDKIVSVIDIPVRTKDEFFQRIQFAHPRLRLGFKRAMEESDAAGAAPAAAPVAAPAGQGLDPELEKLLRRRPGFEYLVAELDWPAQQNRQLGIVLANRMHRVIVGNLKPGSLGEEKLKVLDRIVAVNGAPVSDKDVAKTLIVTAGGKFGALVERPVSEEAKEEVGRRNVPAPAPAPAPEQAPAPPSDRSQGTGSAAVSEMPAGDPRILPMDCLLISWKERELRSKEPKPAPPGILRKAGLRSSSKISHAEKHSTTDIHDDTRDKNPNKRLRPTPKLFS